MYTNIYDTFDKQQIKYSFPFSFKENRQDYMRCKGIATYELDYGDTCIIPFKISPEYLDWTMDIIIYNNRYEEIYKLTTTADKCHQIYLPIDNELSRSLKKGHYYIQVQAYYYLLGGTTQVSTLCSAEDCSLWVR